MNAEVGGHPWQGVKGCFVSLLCLPVLSVFPDIVFLCSVFSVLSVFSEVILLLCRSTIGTWAVRGLS